MPFFPDEPAVRVGPNGRTFFTAEPAHYSGKDDGWAIPEGFETDFATVPAVVSWAIPKLGAYTLAAIVHDLFCVELERFHREQIRFETYGIHRPEPAPVTARDADGIFRRIMRELGVDPVTYWLMWAGVRWGALFSRSRRKGWIKDAPLVLLISLLALPVLILPAWLGRPILRAVQAVVDFVF